MVVAVAAASAGLRLRGVAAAMACGRRRCARRREQCGTRRHSCECGSLAHRRVTGTFAALTRHACTCSYGFLGPVLVSRARKRCRSAAGAGFLALTKRSVLGAPGRIPRSCTALASLRTPRKPGSRKKPAPRRLKNRRAARPVLDHLEPPGAATVVRQRAAPRKP